MIIFNVGANLGTHSIPLTRRHSDAICFAFEPTPSLIEQLIKNTVDIKNRYHVLPYAVSKYNGNANFYVSSYRSGGCSSLNEFSDGLDETWPGRNDLKTDKTIKVEVITLKKFIEEMCPIKIDHIDIFECDAQGSDLDVLKGMGEHLHKIKKGIVEAANNHTVELYKNQHTKEETVQFLQDHKFEITAIKSNDPFNNEYNIHFEKRH